MTVEKESQVYGMHRKSRMEMGCPVFKVEKESKVCAIHKKNRMEPRLTVESVSKL